MSDVGLKQGDGADQPNNGGHDAVVGQLHPRGRAARVHGGVGGGHGVVGSERGG